MLGQFTEDDFTGRLSSNKDRARPPFLGLLSWNLSYVIFLLRDVQTKNKPFKWPDFIQRLGCGCPFRLFLVYFRNKCATNLTATFDSNRYICYHSIKYKWVLLTWPYLYAQESEIEIQLTWICYLSPDFIVWYRLRRYHYSYTVKRWQRWSERKSFSERRESATNKFDDMN